MGYLQSPQNLAQCSATQTVYLPSVHTWSS